MNDPEHLLMENDHSPGLAEYLRQILMWVTGRAPAVLDIQVRGDHVGVDRPGAEQRYVDDQVTDAARLQPGHQLTLAGRFDLEAAERTAGADHLERRLVVEPDRVDVDPFAPGALDLGERVGHRRLHAHAEHVQFDHPGGFHVIHVELAQRKALGALLHRHPVQQRPAGQDPPARVHRDVTGQPVEPFGHQEQAGQLGNREVACAQFGQVGQGGADAARPDVAERLGQRADLLGWQAERGRDVPDRTAGPVGLHHRDAAAALLAVAFDDRVVGLDPPRRLDVQVDVRQVRALLREKPLHDQAMAERVDAGNADQVVDQAASPGAADGTADAAGPDEAGHVGHVEEVRGETGPGDDAELVAETFGHLAAAPGLSGQFQAAQPVGTEPPQPGELIPAGLGQVQAANAQIPGLVEVAALGQLRRGGQQPVGRVLAVAVAAPARAADPLRDLD